MKLAQGWLEGVEFIKAQPERAYTLIGTIKDFNIPADLAKTMLGGVKLADYADNKAFFGTRGADPTTPTSSKWPRRCIARTASSSAPSTPRPASTAATCDQLNGKFPNASSEAPTEYKEPPKGATPIATQRRSIYFDTNSAKMGLDSRAVVDEIGGFMQGLRKHGGGYRWQHRRHRLPRAQHGAFQGTGRCREAVSRG